NFLITAWYTNGVIITDITHPDNMIKTGWYDTSPYEGDGFYGSWRVMPFLPSGVLITSDRQDGLFILQPTYVLACYLEGIVTDAVTGAPIFDADITIELSPDAATATSITGEYKTGILNAGLYDITFTKAGYEDVTVEDVSFANGVLTELNIEMSYPIYFSLTGLVIDAETGLPVENAAVLLNHLEENYETASDASGNFTLPEVYEASYSIYCGKWGYQLKADTNMNLDPASELIFYLSKGYYDDFTLDYGWDTTITGAVTGFWKRAEPVGTINLSEQSNPAYDVDNDFADRCFVTGNDPGIGPGSDDIDGGHVALTSPVFNLTDYDDPLLYYSRWFYNGGGDGFPNDTLTIHINNGIENILIDTAYDGTGTESQWIEMSFHVADYIDITSDMSITFSTGDQLPGHLVEAAVDKFYIIDSVLSVPLVNMESSDIELCSSATINFSDLSDYDPFSWEWNFEGGTPSTSYLKNPVVNYSTPGIYDVTLSATNFNGTSVFTFPDYITIYEAPELLTSAGIGTASVNITGGTPPYSINWSDPLNQTTETASGLLIGEYIVTVTDVNGCLASDTVIVDMQNAIHDHIHEIIVNAFPNPFINEINFEMICSNDLYVQLIIFDVAGREIFTKRLYNGLNNLQVPDMMPGIYSAKIITEDNLIIIFNLIKTE
ncbi:MAG: carboxypeptidase regulatory-like domain-containing protein, partial [Chitinophagales bacterium]|nr:carboxypeptidase regulatory-like domain-containing protein [Chitinophagales bacterium]